MMQVGRILRRRGASERIRELRKEIAGTDRERSPLTIARLSHRLALLYVEEERRADAVRTFGQAIDSYIYAGFTSAAAAMCSRLIEYEPRVVRARATLAMLCLAAGSDEDAEDAIRGFVDVSRERGDRLELTVQKLRAIAELAEARTTRALIAESLRELGEARGAQEILDQLGRELRGGPTRRLSEHERWSQLLELATGETGVTRGAAELGSDRV